MGKRNKTQETTLTRLPKCTTGIEGLDEISEGGLPRGRPTLIRGISERKRAEEELRKASLYARSLIEASLDPLVTISSDGKITDVNEATEQVTGITRNRLIGSDFSDYFTEPVNAREGYKRVLTEGLVRDYPLSIRHISGRTTDVLYNATIYRNEAGEVQGVFAAARDITERKKAEEALRLASAYNRSLIEASLDPLVTIGSDGRITDVNIATEKVTGHSREELIGTDFMDYFSEPEKAKAGYQQVFQDGFVQDYALEIRHKDGHLTPVLYNASVYRDEGGQVIGVFAAARDITERKRTEKALQESEKRYRRVVENATDIIYTVDEKGNFTYANPAGLKVTGYSVGELRKLNFADLILPEHRETVSQIYMNQFRERLPTTYVEFPFIGKAGEIIWFGQNSTIVMEGDKIVGFHIIARDITERKRAEEVIKGLARFPSENPTPVLRIERDGTLLYANEASYSILRNWQLELGRPAPLILQKVAFEALTQQIGKTIDTEHGQRTISFSVAPIVNAGYANFYGLDITERKKMEETLRKSEEKYRTILGNIEEGYYEVDLAGNFTFLNDSMCRIFGYPKKELMGMNDRQYTEKENANRLFQAFNEVYRTGEPDIGYSYEIIRKDGTKRYIEASILLQKDSSDKPIGFRGIIRDITERKQAEEKLRDSEVRYRDLIETARDVILTLSPQGVFTSFNRVFETITGWSTKEWIGKVFVDLLDPNDVPKAIQRFKGVMEGQLGKPIELRVRTKYGGVVHGEFVASPQVKEGKVIGILGVVRDITERKRAEEALRQEKDFNQTLVQASPLFIVAIGPDGKTLTMNEAMLHALGYTTDEVVGKDYLSTFVPVADREILLPIFQKLVNQKESTLNENRVLIKDGRELLVEWHGRPVFKANGDLDYFIGMGIDITQRRQVEEKMAVLQEQLRESQKIEAIGRLAGGIAHDFNNLLTVISGNCQLSLLELKEDVPLKGNIEEIKRASERAADLTRQLLAFSRRQIMEMKVLDLNDLLKNLDKMLRRVIGEDIELVTLLAEDLGKVKTDPGQTEQVIMNLSVNARDAMPEGGKLTIETANVDLDDAYARNHVSVTPGRFVMISVSDTGVGMTPEVRDRVFEPFFTTKEKGKGTGLGLSTVYGIVNQSGGNIWVYSEPRKGATFKIYLPRVDEPLEKWRERAEGQEIPRGKETILIVEDEEDVRKLAVRILERQGYKVLEASEGLDAFLVAEEYEGLIHLLVTDVVMPKMGGRELADRIAELCPEIKVLYMSGYTDNAIVHHGVLGEGMEFIQKPFTVEGLARKVREVLDKDLKPVV